ncbi:unnamed protein product [Lupinus luteus]|uniref:Dof zinc finger protein n=1 Tax=Lupinus luteus TaxID=3873 RepID=A0AAV1WGX7_LUPLU
MHGDCKTKNVMKQPNHQAAISTQNFETLPSLLLPPPTTITVVEGGNYQNSIRLGSMVDRARLARMHQPDAAQKCPRCESTNTKFCYYNNYSLSQPRHFCKTCHRYWTRGGALRKAPVGGGYRRNKKSQVTSIRNRSKSPTKTAGSRSTCANSNSSSGCNNSTDVMGHLQTQFPFLPTLHHNSYIGTSLSGGDANNDADFQWRLPNLQQVQQQFPSFFNSLEPQVGLLKFDGENTEPPGFVRGGGMRFTYKALDSTVSGIIPEVNTTKMEENHGLSLSKNVLGSNSGNNVCWSGSGTAWSEVPSFTPSTNQML